MSFARLFNSILLGLLLFSASGCMSHIEVDRTDSQVSRVLKSWRSAKDIFLVIDADKPAMWLEYKGFPIDEFCTKLPEKMKWSIYHLTPYGSERLNETVRLQVRGSDNNLNYPEEIYFVGRNTGNHMWYMFNSENRSRSSKGTSAENIPGYKGKKKESEKTYRSIIVDEQEYATYLTGLKKQTKEEVDKEVVDLFFHGSDSLRSNLSRWQSIEKKMYDEIICLSSQAGYKIDHIELQTGPDYLAGHAETLGRLNRFLSSTRVDGNFNFEYLGQGVWYVCSMPKRYMGEKIEKNNIEFLVSAEQQVPDDEMEKWLAKGRRSVENSVLKPSKWRAKLANGLIVEFVGICKHPSGINEWFGPDGSELGFIPYSNFERVSQAEDNSSIYDIAWRVIAPSNVMLKSTGSMEGAFNRFIYSSLDKYGYDSFDGDVYEFKNELEKTTWTRGIKIDSGEYCRVKFENISLVRGKDAGFKIVVEDGK